MTTTGRAAAAAERMRAEYTALFGHVPDLVERRIFIAELAERVDAVEAVEALRDVLITRNPLGLDRQQLVHFGQLIVLGQPEAARRHAIACQQNGATIAELTGVVETALITAGVPAYNLGIDILCDLFVP